MPVDLDELQEQAKQLDSRERARLAYFLLESLGPDDADQASEAEISARWAEIERGEVQPVPADEVFAELRRKLL